jgi:flagellar protein FlaG
MESLGTVAQGGVVDHVSAATSMTAVHRNQTVEEQAAIEEVKSSKSSGTTNSGNSQTPNSVEKTVKDLNDAVKVFNTSLSFSVDKDTGRAVVKVVDLKTKEVIRQIPSDEMLRLASRINDLLGILFDRKQ